MSKTEPVEHLKWTDLEMALWHESALDWYKKISSLQSGNLINLHRIAIDRMATPRSLSRLFKAHREHGEPLAGIKKWEQMCQKYSPTLLEGGIDFRRKRHYCKNFLVYQYRARRPSVMAKIPRSYVVGLTGDVGLLMAPIPFVLESLGLLGWDLLLVRRIHSESYLGGNGARLQDLAEGLLEILPSFHRRTDRGARGGITVIGTSAGALPALVLAEHLEARRGIALGALASESMLQGDGSLELSRRRLVHHPHTPLLMAYPAEHGEDEGHGRRIARALASSLEPPVQLTLRGYTGCASHTLHRDLADQGWTLAEIHRHLLGDSPTAIDLAATQHQKRLPPISCREERVI